MVAFAAQFAGLVAWSWHLWTQFDLADDMATFSQAFQQIGSGNLNPYETTFAWNYPHYGYPFYQSHLELLMWPLGLLHALGASSFALLVVQDLALAGSGLVAVRWGLELLDGDWPGERRGAWWVGAGLAIVLLVCAWTYWSGSYDFHFQPVATFFVLLAGRDLWAGRRRMWWWVVLVLMCGDVAATYLLALGLAGIVSGRATRRNAVWLLVVGIAWLAFVGLVHSGKGSSLSGGYGYLTGFHVGTGVGGLLAIVGGLALHPTQPVRVLWHRLSDLFQFVGGAGLIGLASPLGLAAVLVVLVPNGLNEPGIYVTRFAAFPNFFVVMFVAVGAVQLLSWLAQRSWSPSWTTSLVVVGAVVVAVIISVQAIPGVRGQFLRTDARTASGLSAVAGRISDHDEVIAPYSVAGRLGSRRWIYLLRPLPGGQIVPIFGPTVDVVLIPGRTLDDGGDPTSEAAAAAMMRRLHAGVITDRDGVIAFRWHPPRGTRTLTFP
jgi:hypothetical protein